LTIHVLAIFKVFLLALCKAELNHVCSATSISVGDRRQHLDQQLKVEKMQTEESSKVLRDDAKAAEISHFETVVKSFLFYEHHGEIHFHLHD
jgi:hypothetical protein